MNSKLRPVLLTVLLTLTLLFAAGCAPESTPYKKNDEDHYSLSVKFDANGGIFTTNTSVIVDSYNLSEIPVQEGKVNIPLLRPDDTRRDDKFKAEKNGYFLAGWYAKCEQGADGACTYAEPWDFEKDRLTLDPNGSYTASEPVLTLYAAWVPLFEVEYYDRATGELLQTGTLDPTHSAELKLPRWNSETGAIEMNDFPARSGYTFESVYYDAEGTRPVEGDKLAHPGVLNTETATGENSTLKLYVDWTEGEWYHIYNVEQFLKHASVNGSYELHADLDFEGEIWPTALMYGSYAGTIRGNGHTISNVEITQTNNSKINAGLFGSIADTAEITDLTLSGITFTIKAGTRMGGTSFGLLAGAISSDASISGVKILDSALQVDSGCYFGTDDYTVGLICGRGELTGIDTAEITCTAVGDDPDRVVITVSGNAVTLDFVEN